MLSDLEAQAGPDAPLDEAQTNGAFVSMSLAIARNPRRPSAICGGSARPTCSATTRSSSSICW